MVERRLPVHFEPSAEDRMDHVTIEPPTVLVRGPEEILDHTRSIPTQPTLLPPPPDNGSGPQTLTVGPICLVQELEGQSIRVTPEAVMLQVLRQPRRKTQTVEVAVQFLCPPDFRLRPHFEGGVGNLTLNLEGPVTEQPPVVTAYVDLTHGKWEPGLHQEPLRVQLPRECELIPSTPPSISFRLDPPDLAVEGAVHFHEQ
jgi:hypothetical protein